MSKKAEIITDGNQWFITDKNDHHKILEPAPAKEGEDDFFNSHEDFLRSVSKNNPDYADYINSHILKLSKDIDNITNGIAQEAMEAEYEKLAVELGVGGGYGEDMANSAAEKRLAQLKELIGNNEQTQDIGKRLISANCTISP